MNFNKLPKEKRTHLILVIAATVLVLGGIGFGLIKRQYDNIRVITSERHAEETKLQRMVDAIQGADRAKIELEGLTRTLAEQEDGMASGDPYSWLISTLRAFKLSYRVDTLQFSPIVGPTDMNLMPRFPYQQVTMTVASTAYYHDFGRFVSDFENLFPLIRIVNLSLEPMPASSPADREKLAFRMDVVALVKPNRP